jgi:hypothetical protein
LPNEGINYSTAEIHISICDFPGMLTGNKRQEYQEVKERMQMKFLLKMESVCFVNFIYTKNRK